MLQLNGFAMQAPDFDGGGSIGSMQWTFHGLLLVDTGGAPEWRNWSYWHQHFDRLTPQQAKMTHLHVAGCEPTPDFVPRLPLFVRGDREIRPIEISVERDIRWPRSKVFGDFCWEGTTSRADSIGCFIHSTPGATSAATRTFDIVHDMFYGNHSASGLSRRRRHYRP
ncbi:hypothetical protein [Bradyrhizobium sp. NP1]|uniref:hypothetical protein n=1 Tax=Bradyrhizobium sp. NP1 TaxID=3049772 RepID=UPI0025A4FF4A|nr:hypothetical protein [Bradyrhizobium sp. NP1]WJR76466.1 hypothetical protein QOU61_27435 [Bradyrhizobium sp. NP1]